MNAECKIFVDVAELQHAHKLVHRNDPTFLYNRYPKNFAHVVL